jgi:hypothetical protein
MQNALEEIIANRATEDGHFAIAYAILKLAQAQEEVAQHMRDLARPDGTVEFVGGQLRIINETLSSLTSAVEAICD